jgi:hypothetical protein
MGKLIFFHLKFPFSFFLRLLSMTISVSTNHRKRATFIIFVKISVVFVHFLKFFSQDAKMFSTVAKGLAKNLLIPKKFIKTKILRE